MKRILLFALLTFALAFSATAATGDVNSDGEVNISDVNALIDMILSEDSGAAGDVNGDGEINIADADSVIDIVILGGNAGHTRIPAADVNGDGEIDIADVNAIINKILKIE
jgi:hypothetical protein